MMRRQSRNRGILIQETVATIVLAIAVLAGVTQLMALVCQHRRVTQQRSMANRELGNLMEEIMRTEWADLTAEKLDQLQLSTACQQVLSDPRLRVSVVPDESSAETVRISVQLDWQNPAGQRPLPARLVAWRYRHEELTP